MSPELQKGEGEGSIRSGDGSMMGCQEKQKKENCPIPRDPGYLASGLAIRDKKVCFSGTPHLGERSKLVIEQRESNDI